MKLYRHVRAAFNDCTRQSRNLRINPMNGQDQRQQVVGTMSADSKGMPSAVRIDFGPPMFAHATTKTQKNSREREGFLRSGQLDWLSVAGFAPRDGCDGSAIKLLREPLAVKRGLMWGSA
jgi:hypothetical protein